MWDLQELQKFVTSNYEAFLYKYLFVDKNFTHFDKYIGTFILFQTKFSHPKSIQLVPRRSLVSPDRPLLSLVATADVDQGDQTSPSLANSMIADADLRRVKEQLPPQHPARRLLVSPAEVRKKLSQQQIDDLLQMIGSNDFIRLVFSLYLHIWC